MVPQDSSRLFKILQHSFKFFKIPQNSGGAVAAEAIGVDVRLAALVAAAAGILRNLKES